MARGEGFNRGMYWVGLALAIVMLLVTGGYVFAFHIKKEYGHQLIDHLCYWQIENACNQLSRRNNYPISGIKCSMGAEAWSIGYFMLVAEDQYLLRQISDISPLTGLRIKHLDLPGTSVCDISALREMPLLMLNLHNCNAVCDLSPLSGGMLDYLDISETSVRDLSPLRGMPLRYLFLRGSKVTDLSPLRGMPLECLDISDTSVENLAPLEGMDIRTLRISNTPAERLRKKQPASATGAAIK